MLIESRAAAKRSQKPAAFPRLHSFGVLKGSRITELRYLFTVFQPNGGQNWQPASESVGLAALSLKQQSPALLIGSFCR
jgi:hypothetical protein